MKIKDLHKLESFKEMTPPEDPNRKISTPYCCDLLSMAMRDAIPDSAWCTVMNNVNSLAVASITDVSCIILCEGSIPSEDMIRKAKEMELCIYVTELSIFQASLEIYKLIEPKLFR